jgi:hypothetical protein
MKARPRGHDVVGQVPDLPRHFFTASEQAAVPAGLACAPSQFAGCIIQIL